MPEEIQPVIGGDEENKASSAGTEEKEVLVKSDLKQTLGKKSSKRLTILLVVLLVVAVAAAGYLSWGSWGEKTLKKLHLVKTETVSSTSTTSTATTAVEVINTDDWSTYTLPVVNLIVKHPVDWGTASSNTPISGDPTYAISFPNKTDNMIGYATGQVTVGRGGAVFEAYFQKTASQTTLPITLDGKTVGGIFEYKKVTDDSGPGFDKDMIFAAYFKTGSMYSNVVLQMPDTAANREIAQNVIKSIKPVSAVTSIDDTWNLYTNNKYSFTMKFPKQIAESDCAMNSTTKSYGSSDEILVPTTTFEDGSDIYIGGAYFKELTGQVQHTAADGGVSTTYSGCKKTYTSPAILKREQTSDASTWPMFIKISMNNVASDAALASFIKTKYGASCGLGEKEINAANTYDVAVLSDGKDIEASNCVMNYWYAMKYSPVLGLLAQWNMGQDSVFYTAGRAVIYDKEMVDSFRFSR